MKKAIVYLCVLVIFTACNSSKKAAAQKQRDKERMEKLESEKKQFEQKNKEELK